jgi:hypothetical protein
MRKIRFKRRRTEKRRRRRRRERATEVGAAAFWNDSL